jgi:hypothetical protein
VSELVRPPDAKKGQPPAPLFGPDSPLIGESDILSDLTSDKSSSLFLGRYSMTEVMAVLGKRNFFKEAERRGLWPLAFDLDSSNYPVQRLQIFHEQKRVDRVIVDLKIREGHLTPKDYLHLDPSFFRYSFLIFEWLTIQDPLLNFSEKRPPLPGQEHPGLGLGKKVVDVFSYLARLSRQDGLLAFPAYFHNALLFSRYFSFLNPEKAAEIQAIKNAFPSIPFKHMAWIVYLNCLRNADGKAYEWRAEEQVHPLEKTLRAYFDAKIYKDRFKQHLKRLSFTIDWEGYEQKLDELIKIKLTDKA